MHFQKPMLGIPLDWSHPFNKDLVLAYALNEGHGDVVRDLSMNGNHGTLKNMAFPPTVASGWNPGQTGVGLNFDGTNDYVDCGNNAILNPTDSVSVSVWIKPVIDSAWHIPISKGWAYHIAIDPTDDFSFYSLDSGGNDVSFSTSAIPYNGKWVHLTMTIEPSANPQLIAYIDGVQVGTDYDAAYGAPRVDAENLWVGDISSPGRNFDGSIDQVRIYSRALSGDEICRQYINPWQVYLDEDDD